jgi:hypothetical protein
MMVFTHSVAPIFKKLIFFAFHRISQASLHPHPHPNAKSTYECESIPLISRPNIIDDSQEYPKYNPRINEQSEEAGSL